MVLVAGSYERFIWGFSFKTLNPKTPPNPSKDSEGDDEGSSSSSSLKPLFSYPAHTGPIKCVAISGPVAVSGGADDTVKIYDLSSCSEIGSLTDFNGGAVTSAAFYSPPSLSFPRNLITGSDSGVVSIYDADPFVHLKSIRKVHKRGAGIGDLAVHPSGRLALSVGRGDSSLAMVNLVRGRRSFICRLDKEASIIRYSLGTGDLFFMAAGEKISVHSAEDAKELIAIIAEKKVLCIAPTLNKILITGGEGRDITAWDVESGKEAYSIKNAHSARVKGVAVISSSGGGNVLASAATDGVIRVWDGRMVSSQSPAAHLAEVNTKSRLTCLAGPSLK